MKPGTYLIFGLLVGCMVQWLVLPHAGRYTVTTLGHTVIRTDSTTGKSWFLAGTWQPIPENVSTTKKPASEAPASFQPDAPIGNGSVTEQK